MQQIFQSLLKSVSHLLLDVRFCRWEGHLPTTVPLFRKFAHIRSSGVRRISAFVHSVTRMLRSILTLVLQAGGGTGTRAVCLSPTNRFYFHEHSCERSTFCNQSLFFFFYSQIFRLTFSPIRTARHGPTLPTGCCNTCYSCQSRRLCPVCSIFFDITPVCRRRRNLGVFSLRLVLFGVQALHDQEAALGHLPQKWHVLWNKLDVPIVDTLVVSGPTRDF